MNLCDLPGELLACILEVLPLVECIARVECVANAFHATDHPSQSVVERALRLRAARQVGVRAPEVLTLRELYTMERCRQGLHLSPIIDRMQSDPVDTRRSIFLVRGDGHLSRPSTVRIGRQRRRHPGDPTESQCITDPRVSRLHAEVTLHRVSAGGHSDPFNPQLPVARFDARGMNPSRLISGSRGIDCRLHQGAAFGLHPGDVLHLVCEERVPAMGVSAAFEGNACAYRVDLVSERELRSLALARHILEGQPSHTFEFSGATLPDWQGACTMLPGAFSGDAASCLQSAAVEQPCLEAETYEGV